MNFSGNSKDFFLNIFLYIIICWSIFFCIFHFVFSYFVHQHIEKIKRKHSKKKEKQYEIFFQLVFLMRSFMKIFSLRILEYFLNWRATRFHLFLTRFIYVYFILWFLTLRDILAPRSRGRRGRVWNNLKIIFFFFVKIFQIFQFFDIFKFLNLNFEFDLN